MSRFTLLCLLVSLQACWGKIFTKCELASLLKFDHAFTRDQIKNWVCLVEHESSFNSSAISIVGSDGSRALGLFQLNARMACGEGGQEESVCGMHCQALLDADLADDIVCASQLIQNTQIGRPVTDPLLAWDGYADKCQSLDLNAYIEECSEDLAVPSHDSTNEVSRVPFETQSQPGRQKKELDSTTLFASLQQKFEELKKMKASEDGDNPTESMFNTEREFSERHSTSDLGLVNPGGIFPVIQYLVNKREIYPERSYNFLGNSQAIRPRLSIPTPAIDPLLNARVNSYSSLPQPSALSPLWYNTLSQPPYLPSTKVNSQFPALTENNFSSWGRQRNPLYNNNKFINPIYMFAEIPHRTVSNAVYYTPKMTPIGSTLHPVSVNRPEHLSLLRHEPLASPFEQPFPSFFRAFTDPIDFSETNSRFQFDFTDEFLHTAFAGATVIRLPGISGIVNKHPDSYKKNKFNKHKKKNIYNNVLSFLLG